MHKKRRRLTSIAVKAIMNKESTIIHDISKPGAYKKLAMMEETTIPSIVISSQIVVSATKITARFIGHVSHIPHTHQLSMFLSVAAKLLNLS